MTISAIVTSHDNPVGMNSILEHLNFKQQIKPEQIIANYSIVFGSEANYLDTIDRRLADYWMIDVDRSDWGHQKRAHGLVVATCDYTAFFNDDDVYSSKYLARLIAKAERTDADIVACDFVSHLAPGQINLTEPKIGRITSGNFIVRTSLAKQVGYISRDYAADGQFIEDLMNAGATFARVPEVLYVHN